MKATEGRACVYIGIHVTPADKSALRAEATLRQTTMREHLDTRDMLRFTRAEASVLLTILENWQAAESLDDRSELVTSLRRRAHAVVSGSA